MKIRKFNESLDDSLIEYIEECFVEFLDNNNSEIVKAENPNSKGSYYIVNIKLDVEEKNNTTSFIEENEISSLVDYHTYLSSTLNDVNDSISKLRIRYDNTALVVRITTGYDYINCFINPKKTT